MYCLNVKYRARLKTSFNRISAEMARQVNLYFSARVAAAFMHLTSVFFDNWKVTSIVCDHLKVP